MKIFVAEKYDNHTHDFHPIKDGHRTTLDGARKVAEAACPLPMKWAEPYTTGQGQRCWRAEEVVDLERDDRGYLPAILPSDFMVREVELIEDTEPEPCILCGGSKRAPVMDHDGATWVAREVSCPLCQEDTNADQG